MLSATNGQINSGSLAVDAFFAISGFLIAASWERSRGLLDFLWRRVLRIYPGYIVAFVFCATVAGPLGSDSVGEYRSRSWWGGFAKGVLNLDGSVLPPSFLHNPSNAVNGSLWTIRYEFLCYLLVALLGVAGLLRRGVVLVLLALAYSTLLGYDFGFGSYRFVPRGESIDTPIRLLGFPSAWSRFLTFFLAGSAAYFWRSATPRSGALAAASAAALVVGIWLPPLFVDLLPICGTYLLFWAAFAPWMAATRPRADLSYGVYLYAFPVQQLVISATPGIGPLLLTAVAIPLTLALASMSWLLVESPALRLKWRASNLATIQPKCPRPEPPS